MGLGLWGECWGREEPELQDGSTLGVLGQAEERGRRWGCEVLGGVSLRGQAEVGGTEAAGGEELKAGGGGWRGFSDLMDIPKIADRELRELAGEELWVPLLAVLVLNTFPPGSAGGREGAG